MQDPKRQARAREQYAAGDMTVGEICCLLGVSNSTFYSSVPTPAARHMPDVTISQMNRVFRFSYIAFLTCGASETEAAQEPPKGYKEAWFPNNLSQP
jgi:hypothetical protein